MSAQIKHIFILKEEYRKCSICSYYKTLDHFGYSKNISNNLTSQCKNCISLIMQKKKLKINPNYKYRGNYQRYIQGVTVIERKGPIVKIIPRIYILGDAFKKCNRCGYWKSLDVFNNSKSTFDRKHTVCKDCIRKKTGRSKGRPIGWIMPEEVKEKIRQSNIGKTLSEDHKLRISKKLMGNTNRRTNFSTLVDDLLFMYQDPESEAWISRYKEALEDTPEIRTEHSLYSESYRELDLSEKADMSICGISPEALLLIKEEIKKIET